MTQHEIYAIAKSLGLRIVAHTGLRSAGAPPLPVELEVAGMVLVIYVPLSGEVVIPGVARRDARDCDERDILKILATAAVDRCLRSQPCAPALLEVLDRCLGRIPRLPVDPL